MNHEEKVAAFQAMEDERAEFEATFGDLQYDLTRLTHCTRVPQDDYLCTMTGEAWAGWLAHARISWVPAP